MSAKAEPAYVIVARNISRLRYQREITQEKICELADVDRGYYQRVESGKQNMTIDYLDRMRKALKCQWADLFQGLDQPEPLPMGKPGNPAERVDRKSPPSMSAKGAIHPSLGQRPRKPPARKMQG